MATKKNDETVEAPVIEEDEPVIEEDEREDIFIPRGDAKGDPNLFVSVNNYSAILPRGQVSRVPHYVAEEIRRSFAAENAFYQSSQEREIKEEPRQ